MIAAVHSAAGALTLVGWLVVLGALVAAAVAGWRGGWIPALVLLVVAIVAAALLL